MGGFIPSRRLMGRTVLFSVFATFLLTLGFMGDARAQQGQPPSKLEQILGGTVRQPITQLDKAGLKLILNDRMTDVLLEGWNTKSLSPAEADKLFAKFGVRTVAESGGGTSFMLTPDNVGRAGIEEGPVYMKLNGKVYKGLTLKGYGGNTLLGRSEQPEGSLELSESIRDMEVSTIFVENNVDTYVGVLAVERPGKLAGYSKATPANFVRISRTALRMEDLMRVTGSDLNKLVDYLTDLFSDELGRKLSVQEFDEWLIKKTGDLMARKDYIRFAHSSITDSNLGIGEMVDLGDTWAGGLQLPGEYKSQNAEFKRIAQKVHNNIVAANPQLVEADFSKMYDAAYEARLKELAALDAARVNLNRATTAELVKLGFSQLEADEIVKLNGTAADGIIDPAEVLSIKNFNRDVRALLDSVTTDFMRLSDGSQLSAYYIRNVGEAEGVRTVLGRAREYLKQNPISLERDAKGSIERSKEVLKFEAELEKYALEQAEKLGNSRVLVGNELTKFSKFIARQALEVIVKR